MRPLGLRRGKRSVNDDVGVQSPLERRYQDVVKGNTRRYAGKLDQQVDRAAGLQRKGKVRQVLQHQRHAEIGEEFQGRDEFAGFSPQQLQSSLQRQAGQGRGARRPLLRRRKELQHSTGDHAQRAFGAAEQLAQLVAGIVLLHRRGARSTRCRPLRRPPVRARDPASCHSGRRGCRRHWFRSARRCGRCPRRRDAAERSGHAAPARGGAWPAPRRPRRESIPLAKSGSPIAVMRASDRITASAWSATAPPQRLVFPPWGTTGHPNCRAKADDVSDLVGARRTRDPDW